MSYRIRDCRDRGLGLDASRIALPAKARHAAPAPRSRPSACTWCGGLNDVVRASRRRSAPWTRSGAPSTAGEHPDTTSARCSTRPASAQLPRRGAAEPHRGHRHVDHGRAGHDLEWMAQRRSGPRIMRNRSGTAAAASARSSSRSTIGRTPTRSSCRRTAATCRCCGRSRAVSPHASARSRRAPKRPRAARRPLPTRRPPPRPRPTRPPPTRRPPTRPPRTRPPPTRLPPTRPRRMRQQPKQRAQGRGGAAGRSGASGCRAQGAGGPAVHRRLLRQAAAAVRRHRPGGSGHRLNPVNRYGDMLVGVKFGAALRLGDEQVVVQPGDRLRGQPRGRFALELPGRHASSPTTSPRAATSAAASRCGTSPTRTSRRSRGSAAPASRCGRTTPRSTRWTSRSSGGSSSTAAATRTRTTCSGAACAICSSRARSLRELQGGEAGPPARRLSSCTWRGSSDRPLHVRRSSWPRALQARLDVARSSDSRCLSAAKPGPRRLLSIIAAP